jgi:hypothetical protein
LLLLLLLLVLLLLLCKVQCPWLMGNATIHLQLSKVVHPPVTRS